MYIQPVVTNVVSMDLQCSAGGHYSTETTIAYEAVFQGGYYLRGLLNKGGVYLRKFGI